MFFGRVLPSSGASTGPGSDSVATVADSASRLCSTMPITFASAELLAANPLSPGLTL